MASLYSSSSFCILSFPELRSSPVICADRPHIHRQTPTHPCLACPWLSAPGGLIKESGDNEDVRSQRVNHQSSGERQIHCLLTQPNSCFTPTEPFPSLLVKWRVEQAMFSWKQNGCPHLLHSFSLPQHKHRRWREIIDNRRTGGIETIRDVGPQVSRLSALLSRLSPAFRKGEQRG